MYLGRYEVIRKIGSGGFGEVLLARALGAEGFERIVALKRLKGELARRAGSLKGIVNEARIGGLLNHPNIVQVLEFIHLEPDFLLVMEYVDGIALHEVLEMEREASGLLTPGLALDIAIQACEGLHYAHTARSPGGKPLKLVHRDIKPSNLMITRTGTVKIMDFGVARSSANTGQSSTGSIKGTLRYLSPEQAEGSREIRPQSDIFSLGLVLCEMMIGHPVYEAEQEHLVLLKALQADTRAAVAEAEEKVPGIGPILSRCLATEPSGRFKAADALGQALRRLRKDFPLGSGLVDMVEKAMARRQKAGDETDLSEETSFSLELRLRGMDRRPIEAMGVDSDGSGGRGGQGTGSGIRDTFGDEPWEWEWRVTTYPSARSELEVDEEPDFDHLDSPGEKVPPDSVSSSRAPEEQDGETDPVVTDNALAVGRVNAGKTLPKAGSDNLSLPFFEPAAVHIPRARASGHHAVEGNARDLPFVAEERGLQAFWATLQARIWFQLLVGMVVAGILIAVGFLLGVRYATVSALDDIKGQGVVQAPERPVQPR